MLTTVTRKARSPGRARNKPLKPLRAGITGGGSDRANPNARRGAISGIQTPGYLLLSDRATVFQLGAGRSSWPKVKCAVTRKRRNRRPTRISKRVAPRPRRSHPARRRPSKTPTARRAEASFYSPRHNFALLCAHRPVMTRLDDSETGAAPRHEDCRQH